MSLSKQQWNKSFENEKDYTPLNEVFINELLIYLKKENKNIKTFLDLGCGTGDALVKFAKKSFDCVGVDFSEEALDLAKKRVKEESVESLIELIEEDLNNLDINVFEKDFDIVFSKLNYAFIKDKKEFLIKIKKLIEKSGGKFILITPVILENYEYSNFLRNISVSYKETLEILEEIFDEVEIFHKEYFNENGLKATFILK